MLVQLPYQCYGPLSSRWLLQECLLTVQVSVVDLSLPEATVASRVRDACLSSGFFYRAPP